MVFSFSLLLFYQFLIRFTSNYQLENGSDWIKSQNHFGLSSCHRQPDSRFNSWYGELWENLEPVGVFDQALVLWVNGSTIFISTWFFCLGAADSQSSTQSVYNWGPHYSSYVVKESGHRVRKGELVVSQHTRFFKIPNMWCGESHSTFLDSHFSNYI